MLEDRPLFRPALAGVLLQAGWRYPDGWTVRLSTRREGEAWQCWESDVYDRLSTSEALDVLDALVDTLRARESVDRA